MAKLARFPIADADSLPPHQSDISPFLTSASPNHPSAESVAGIARYIADLAAEMESMAGEARLVMLAYFLALARMEAESAALVPLSVSEAENEAAIPYNSDTKVPP